MILTVSIHKGHSVFDMIRRQWSIFVIITLMWQELASFIQRKANQNLSNSGDNKDNIIQAVKHGDENLVRKLLEEDSGKNYYIRLMPKNWFLKIIYIAIFSWESDLTNIYCELSQCWFRPGQFTHKRSCYTINVCINGWFNGLSWDTTWIWVSRCSTV